MALPRFLNLKRLEGRIVALFLALLSAVQLTSFALIHRSIARNADASISHELETGERILQRLLVQDARTREDAARLLEKDHGFRSVLAEGLRGDELRETLKDALISHGERVKASMVAYIDAQERLVAATTERAQPFVDLLPRLTDGRPRNRRASSSGAGRRSRLPGGGGAGRRRRTRRLGADGVRARPRAAAGVAAPVGAAIGAAAARSRSPVAHARLDTRQRRPPPASRSRRRAAAHQFALALGDESMRALYREPARRKRPAARRGADAFVRRGGGTVPPAAADAARLDRCWAWPSSHWAAC